jgi:hypothetical protein
MEDTQRYDIKVHSNTALHAYIDYPYLLHVPSVYTGHRLAPIGPVHRHGALLINDGLKKKKTAARKWLYKSVFEGRSGRGCVWLACVQRRNGSLLSSKAVS